MTGSATGPDEGCTYVADAAAFESWSDHDHGWSSVLDDLGASGEAWECPHEPLPGREECPFHAAPETIPEDVDVQAALRRAIDRSTGDGASRLRQFVGAKLGAVSLEGVESHWNDDRPLAFDGAVVEGPVDLDDATLGGTVSFRHATVREDVTARRATVDGDVTARHATFVADATPGTVDLSDGVVEGVLDLRRASIAGDLDCPRSFLGRVGGRRTTVDGSVDLARATVDGPANFRETSIRGRILFRDATIHGRLGFRSVSVDGLAWFQEVDVDDGVDLRRATVAGEADFHGATVEGGASLRSATIRDGVAFVDAVVEGAFESDLERSMPFLEATVAAVTGESVAGDLPTSSGPERCVDLQDVTVDGELTVKSTEIDGPISCVGGAIGDAVDFFGNTVDGPTTFRGATVGGDAILGGTTFEGPVDFREATVGGDAVLVGTTFEATVDFREASIRGEARLGSHSDATTRFEGDVRFDEASVADGVDLSGTEAVETAFARPPSFVGAELTGSTFARATLPGADFGRADLSESDFRFATLQHASFERSKLSRSEFAGADLRGARLGAALLGDVQVDGETRILGAPGETGARGPLDRLRRRPCCVYDSNYGGESSRDGGGTAERREAGADAASVPEADPDRAKSVYRAVERLAAANARPRLQTRCFVRRQQIQRGQYRDRTVEADGWTASTVAGARYLRSTVAEWTLLYGESPWRIVAWSGVTVVAFAGVYPFGLMETAGGEPLTWRAIGADWSLLIQSVYYSMLTFTALGFGDFRPATPAGQIATVVETSVGAILLALLVFILGRRAAR